MKTTSREDTEVATQLERNQASKKETQWIVVTRECGHREQTQVIPQYGRKESIEFYEGSPCSACHLAEPRVREWLNNAITGRVSGKVAPTGHLLELFAEWHRAMGGRHSQPNYQAVLLANKLVPPGSPVHAGICDLLTKLTSAVADGSIEAPPPPTPPYVPDEETRPRDQVLADGLVGTLELYMECAAKWGPKTRAAMRARLHNVEDVRVRELALRTLELTEPSLVTPGH